MRLKKVSENFWRSWGNISGSAPMFCITFAKVAQIRLTRASLYVGKHCANFDVGTQTKTNIIFKNTIKDLFRYNNSVSALHRRKADLSPVSPI
jgi:hypothetical protein